jgi:hypothetical protein
VARTRPGLRFIAALGAAALGSVSLATSASAGANGDAFNGGSEIKVELGTAELAKLAAGKPARGGLGPDPYEYASVANCPGAAPGSANADSFCQPAMAACAGNTPAQGLGPSVKVFRRQKASSATPPGPWVQVGVTCFPQRVPGKPKLGMAQIVAAFHDTRFAVPSLRIQPKGNVTLVTLPTYFELTWPREGFSPGEVDHPDPARLLGFRVEIRPLLRDVTYVYGDGQSEGPTIRTGGPFPDGNITHAYERGGDVLVRADVTYAGQFRVAGGAWVDIPGDVRVRGTSQRLRVRTAEARLYAR